MSNTIKLIKILIFGDSNSFISNILIREAIQICKKKGIHIVGIVDTAKEHKPQSIISFFIKEVIRYIFNRESNLKYMNILTFNIYKIARENKINVIVPPNRDINDPKFIEFLQTLCPLYGLVLGCPQIFKKETIKCFCGLLNYHNSLLPKYRGLYATAWSLYFNEKVSGYTYHYINEEIDHGNIVHQGWIEVDYNNIAHLEIEKTFKAAKDLKTVVDKMITDYPGTPQSGLGSYFGKKDLLIYTCIEDTKNFTSDEILRRLKVFGFLNIRIGNEIHEVTKVKMSRKRYGKYTFITKDERILEVTRISYLPPLLYKIWVLFKILVSKLK